MPTVRMVPSGAVVTVPRGARLVDAIRAAGLPIATACGDDLICAKCGVRVLAGPGGREAEVERRAKARNRIPATHRLACAVRVRGDLEITADYWGEGRAPIPVAHDADPLGKLRSASSPACSGAPRGPQGSDREGSHREGAGRETADSETADSSTADPETGDPENAACGAPLEPGRGATQPAVDDGTRERGSAIRPPHRPEP